MLHTTYCSSAERHDAVAEDNCWMRELQNAMEDEKWVEVAAAQRAADGPRLAVHSRTTAAGQQQQPQDITEEGWLPT